MVRLKAAEHASATTAASEHTVGLTCEGKPRKPTSNLCDVNSDGGAQSVLAKQQTGFRRWRPRGSRAQQSLLVQPQKLISWSVS